MKEFKVRLKDGVVLTAVREDEPPRWGWPHGWSRPHWKILLPFGEGRPAVGHRRNRPAHVAVRILDSTFDMIFDVVETEENS